MRFLRRFGGQEQPEPAPALRTFDLPSSGELRISGVQHHASALREVFGASEEVVSEGHEFEAYGMRLTSRVRSTRHEMHEVPADLWREPDNRYDPNAVGVHIQGRLVGYIPAERAPAWAAFLQRCEADGYRVRALAEVWIDGARYQVNVKAREDAAYLTPREASEEPQRKADAEAARQAQLAQREARVEQEAAWRAAGLCASCGGVIEPHQGRGRTPVRCASCRAAREVAKGQEAPK